MKTDVTKLIKKRDFSYSDVFVHEDVGYIYNERGILNVDLEPEIARTCKNESNYTVFFNDGTWLTTWGQGSYETSTDQCIVYSFSNDMGKSWTNPKIFPTQMEGMLIPYGVPFIVPETQRVYLFFYVGGNNYGLYYSFSDDRCKTWTKYYKINFTEKKYDRGWLNHGPIIVNNSVVLPITISLSEFKGSWTSKPCEVAVVKMSNILSERDPQKLNFELFPKGKCGIRMPIKQNLENSSLKQLNDYFGGDGRINAFNAQELTITQLPNKSLLGVMRTFLGSPGFSISKDNGETWSKPELLRYNPSGKLIHHPMTMCPITSLSDGRIVLLFTNNDGSKRNAKHICDGKGTTRNPQWFVVGKQVPGLKGNAGIIFGEPRVLVEVDDDGYTNLKTGISMPHFFEYNHRYFVCYNINKEHILLDEIPDYIIDEMTPIV